MSDPRSSSRFVVWSLAGACLVAAGFAAGRWSAGRAAQPGTGHVDVGGAAVAGVSAGDFAAVAPADVSPGEAKPAGSWEQRWKAVAGAAANPRRNAAMAEALRELAGSDPERAMGLAEAEKNLELRMELVRAALNGWAGKDPEKAAMWALRLREQDRIGALEAVFEGAAGRPEELIRVAALMVRQDPKTAGESGYAAIGALSKAGNFEAAVKLAASVSAEHRAEWMSAAYLNWGKHQPEAAMAGAQGLRDEEQRREAMQGVVSGWAQTRPAELAEYVAKLPAGPDRARYFGEALRQWVDADPVSATAWIDKRDPTPDLDEGAAAVATLGAIAQRKPDVAVSWAESITQPELRSSTLAEVVRQWAERDPAAARAFAASSADLSPQDREAVLHDLQTRGK